MSLIIRRGALLDAEFIADFQVQMARETEDKSLDLDLVTTAVAKVFHDPAKGFYLVAELDSRLVGSLMITTEWSDWRNSDMWYFQSVFVKPEFRGQGIFRRMYDHVLELAKQQDVLHARLYVEEENQRAQNVYESLGMKRMPYHMYDIRIGS